LLDFEIEEPGVVNLVRQKEVVIWVAALVNPDKLLFIHWTGFTPLIHATAYWKVGPEVWSRMVQLIRQVYSLSISLVLALLLCSLSLSALSLPLRPNSPSASPSPYFLFPEISQKRPSNFDYSNTFYQIRGFVGELVPDIRLLGM
jgi:hypothetical protein